MTLDQLEIFEKIAEIGSFRGAADSLSRAQSAVSYGVKELERSLGVDLFSREGYRPALTPAGEALLRKARGVLAQARELETLAGALSGGAEPVITLGVSVLCPLRPIIEVIRTFSQRSPTRIRLLSEVLGGVQRVHSGEASLAVTEVMGAFPDTLERVPYGEVTLVPVVSPSHPLAKGPASLRALRRYPQIVLSSTVPGASAGVLPGASTWRVADYRVKGELLCGGLGWGSMPVHLVQEDLEAGRLVRLEASEAPPVNASLYLVRRRGELGPGRVQLWESLAQIDTSNKDG